MTRLERLARLRVKLASIERTKAGANVNRIDGRVRQIATLANGYSPDAGTASASHLAARATFADRLVRTGDTLARDLVQAHCAVVRSERDVHRAEKTVERVMASAAIDRKSDARRLVRTFPKGI